jgi:WD40 repeat protein
VGSSYDIGDPLGDPLRGHTGAVRSVAVGIGTDGRPLLASAGTDKTVRLWDPAAGITIGILRRRTNPTALATQGTQLTIGDSEGVTVVEIMPSLWS